MTLALTATSAEALYKILDENIGVFRTEDMNSGEQKFYDGKREEFLELFSREIPSTYWFQGVELKSIELHFDSTGFALVHEHLHRHTKEIVDNVNVLLKADNFEFAELQL